MKKLRPEIGMRPIFMVLAALAIQRRGETLALSLSTSCCSPTTCSEFPYGTRWSQVRQEK